MVGFYFEKCFLGKNGFRNPNHKKTLPNLINTNISPNTLLKKTKKQKTKEQKNKKTLLLDKSWDLISNVSQTSKLEKKKINFWYKLIKNHFISLYSQKKENIYSHSCGKDVRFFFTQLKPSSVKVDLF